MTEPAFRQRRYWSLIDQMRRSSMSVAANIAEGSGQVTSAQFARYLTIALGSARELDYHVLLAHDLGVLANSDYARLDARVDQVSRMLAAFRDRVAERAMRSNPRRRANQIPGPLTSQLSRPLPMARDSSPLGHGLSHVFRQGDEIGEAYQTALPDL